jgi:DNA-binding HxlR family transcriptional regulator
MARRSYEQCCTVAAALDVLGERWTLLVIRELAISPCRYGELATRLPRMGTNLLATRLHDLEGHGLVARRTDGDGVVRYHLTDGGAGAKDVALALGRFGLPHLPLPPDVTLEPRLLVLGLQTLLRLEELPDGALVVGLEVGPAFDLGGYTLRIQPRGPAGRRVPAHARITCVEGVADDVEVVLHAPLPLLLLARRGDVDAEALLADGRIRVEGPPRAVDVVRNLFGLRAHARAS